MDHVFGWVSSGAVGPLVVAFDAIFRATVLLVLAFGAHAALGRSRALVRSALWNACLIGLLLIPASILALPRLVISAPRLAATPPAAAPVQEALFTPAPMPMRVEGPAPFPPSGLDEGRTSVRPSHEPTAEPPARARFDVAILALGVYLAVAMLLAARLAVALALVHSMKRRCEPSTGREWIEALERWRKTLGIGRPVVLLESERVSVPVVVGWLRPSIILPTRLSGAENRPMIDAVLLHELSHVRRGDFGWNLVRKLVQIAYWPHPLVWPLGRVVGAVREQACDDLCIHVLGAASTYRASLLEVASGLVRRPDPALGLAMARSTNLGKRLAWIDRSRGASRCVMPAPTRLALAGAVLAVAGTIGSIELSRATAAEEPKPVAPKPAEAVPAAQPPAIEIVVTAKDTGKPLAGVTVRSLIDFTHIEQKTDREGRVVVDLSRRLFQDTFGFDVWVDGYIQQRFFFAQNDARNPRIPSRFVVELLPAEETLGGAVTDEAGHPIAGVKVRIWGHLGEKKKKSELAYKVDAVTDAQGRWRSRCFRGLKFAYLYLSHPDYLTDDDAPERRHGRPDPSDPVEPGARTMEVVRDFSDVQILKKGVAISGTVVDDQGRPISNADIAWFPTTDETNLQEEMPTAATDARGDFRFPHARPGRLTLQIKASGHAPELKRIEAKAGAQPVAIQLRAAHTLAGRVVDSKGKPIPDVFVNIDTWRGTRALRVFLKSDADGRFRWNDAPADSVSINASRSGFKSVSRRSASPEEGDILLELKRALSVSGWIRDAETNATVDQTRLEVGVPDPKTGAYTWSEDMQVFAFQGRIQADIDADKASEFRLRFIANGYAPTESRTFRNDEGQVEYDVKLAKAKPGAEDVLSGVVLRPDGKPLEGADVTVTYPAGGKDRFPVALVEDGKLPPSKDQTIAKTDAQGRFRVAHSPDPEASRYALVVVHPECYAEVPRAAFEADSTIKALPWGRIEGTARIGSKPASGAAIRYGAERMAPGEPVAFYTGTAMADEQGRFVAPFAVAGDARVSLQRDGDWCTGVLVEVKAGATTRADVGGVGRPVIARIAAPEGGGPDADHVLNSEFSINNELLPVPYPKDVLSGPDKANAWLKQWWGSPEGRAHRRDNWFNILKRKLQPDGTIRVDDVPPGSYRLRLTYSADPIFGFRLPEGMLVATKQFTIPAIPGGRSDEPLDLGELRPAPKAALKVGEAAPAFDVESLSGGRIKLEDFRGKYVLLDFWATWCGPCVAEIPELKKVHDRFGKDERFAMISLSLDAGKDAPRKFVAEKGVAWPQGFVGDWPDGGPQAAYHVEAIPAMFLIAPDGTLKAQGLRGDAVEAAVSQVLKSK
ncbi:carboxypeptidase regulatory-like domain-containing protein [Paludisphaera borealis]|uniref:Thiol-disulfide oxidoreductase ResA n=1 Tax=Paludisphaera borealis TaxID=1387353 RepID=A0A1U7CT09_9BACT|nr:carboxypeptidase regulatory-like domain-containing protein [Paludisphaera borealis]APW62013.1 Thiol-disulfide oxidoreductase ResA [Paludisphaera borealis]